MARVDLSKGIVPAQRPFSVLRPAQYTANVDTLATMGDVGDASMLRPSYFSVASLIIYTSQVQSKLTDNNHSSATRLRVAEALSQEV